MSIVEPYIHFGYVVPDIEAAMEEFALLTGTEWGPVLDRVSASGDIRWRRVYSVGTPPLVELVEGDPNSPWYEPSGPLLHHVGRFTYDLDEDLDHLLGHGGEVVIDGFALTGRRWAYVRLPRTRALVEVIEVDDETRRTQFGIEPPGS